MINLGEAGLLDAVRAIAAGHDYQPQRQSIARKKGCTGKHRHKSVGAAQAAIRSLLKRGLCDPASVHWYYCRHCGGVHTSNTPKEIKH